MAQLRLCCGVRFDPQCTPMWARIKWEGSILVLFAEPRAGQLGSLRGLLADFVEEMVFFFSGEA